MALFSPPLSSSSLQYPSFIPKFSFSLLSTNRSFSLLSTNRFSLLSVTRANSSSSSDSGITSAAVEAPEPVKVIVKEPLPATPSVKKEEIASAENGVVEGDVATWTMLHEADNVESGQFSFTATETGSYFTCISAVDHKPETTLTIDFDWRSGVHSKDWSKVAKKSQVEMMELSVKSLFDTVNSIHKEIIISGKGKKKCKN